VLAVVAVAQAHPLQLDQEEMGRKVAVAVAVVLHLLMVKHQVLVAQVALVIVAFIAGNYYVRHQSTGIRRIASRC
jgi:hypothetical protein